MGLTGSVVGAVIRDKLAEGVIGIEDENVEDVDEGSVLTDVSVEMADICVSMACFVVAGS